MKEHIVFAYILKAPTLPEDQEGDKFFRRFIETPGLLHAFALEHADGEAEQLVVAVWEGREAAERYLNEAPLRTEVDQAIPGITRTMYEVRDHK